MEEFKWPINLGRFQLTRQEINSEESDYTTQAMLISGAKKGAFRNKQVFLSNRPKTGIIKNQVF
jgi:RNA-binding protein YlmH